jgi:Fe-S oxidoreductase
MCTSYGGSLSGEHGDGQARGTLLPIMFGDEIMKAFREFKSIWDPNGMMNPGKVIDAYPVDVNLRWGSHYHPWEPSTHFAFPDDEGNFSYAANRCVGTGKCRKHDSGTMCPSYMVTREERYSTRGRSRLLFEMLEGNPLRNGWRDEPVREALDLCLSCKGCRSECPVNVDMATYKSEFLSHYFDRRLRPVAHYAFGLMYWWARMASHMPRVANFFTQTRGLSSIAKALATMAPERRIPRFANQTFKAWFRERPVRNVGKPQVLLWADTWNNHFHPPIAIAAVDVLEAAGFQVTVPDVSLCCGRPLYDYGMLGLAERLLRQILDTLRPQIQAGMCVVGLEPSCVSVFRDELVNLITDDEDAKRLSAHTYLLTEFLAEKAPDFTVPPLHRKVLVSGHCHQKSVLRFDDEITLLKKLGVDYTVIDSGCCGMAGAFGFERGDHYDVSIQCGERVLLPAVRAAEKETLIVTSGFSCREQISQTTDREALHVVQLLKLALDEEAKRHN